MTEEVDRTNAVKRWLAGPSELDPPSIRVRLVVQIGFMLLCAYLGVRFAGFIHAAEGAELPLPERPPGVEGFLPISGMMGLLDWGNQGALNTVHPAATVLFIIFVIIAFVARKAFCSWICPGGLLSESLARLGRFVFGRNFRPWRFVDIPLRALKYLVLGFFVYSILAMSAVELRGFIDSTYNQVSDVKMYLFFADVGLISAIVLAVLSVASVFVVGAWCRYLCPYGALLGMFSLFSPLRIHRQESTCIDCESCDDVCMARLPVSRKLSITSVECTGCLDCIAACPEPGTLHVGTRRRAVSPLAFGALVMGLFLAGYAAARVAGIWENEITDQQYVEHMQRLNTPEYGHPGS